MKLPLDKTNKLAVDAESGNRSVTRLYFKRRFTFFKHLMLNDEFHIVTFYPSVRSVHNHACVQILTGKNTGH